MHQANRAPSAVRPSVEKTLADLHVEYLDLFLIHSPFRLETPLKQTWEAMEALVDAGLGTNRLLMMSSPVHGY